MALSPAEIKVLLKAKLQSKLPTELATFIATGVITPELETWLASNPGGTGGDEYLDALTEATVEHLVAKGEISTFVVGVDAGAALTAYTARFAARGTPLPAIPDTELQISAAPGSPSVPPFVSLPLSIKGLID